MKNVDVKGLKNLFDLSKGYFLTTIINQSLPFLLLPVLTRYLTTAEYGQLSLFSFYLLLCHAIIGAAMPTVISKYFFERDKNEIAKLIGNCIYTTLFGGVIVGLLLTICYSWLKPYVLVPLSYLLLLPMGAVYMIIFAIGLNICKNTRKVLHFSCHQIGNTTLNVGFSLLTVCVFYWGWLGRFSSICTAYVVSSIIMLFYLKANGYLCFSYSGELQKEIREVMFPLIPNSVQLILISQAGLFFMQLYFDEDILGKYAMAFQISSCVKLLTVTLNMSWTPFLFQQLSKGDGINKVYLTRCLLVLIALLFLGLIVINVFAYPILWAMTTPDYYTSVEFIPWFTFGFLLLGINTFIKPILIKYNQQKFIGKNSFFAMLFMLLVNIVFAKLFGYKGIVYAFCLVYFILAIPQIIRAQKVYPLPWIKAIRIW
jgi:O-antigen/teichoic acid export membrane protein